MDSAIEKSQDRKTEVVFLQNYQAESAFVDLPLSSKFDYRLARLQDSKLRSVLSKIGLGLETLNPSQLMADIKLDAIDLGIGNEEVVVKTRDSKPCKIHTNGLIEHYARVHKELYIQVREYLLKSRPDQVVIFNGRFYREKAVWRAAVDLNIECRFVERFSPAWGDRYFEFERPVHDIEYRCSIMRDFFDDFAFDKSVHEGEKIAKDWFHNRSLGINQKFTVHQNREFKSDATYSKLITFFHSSEDELLTTNLGSPTWGDQIGFLSELSDQFATRKDILLLIRIHPNLRYKSHREIRRWYDFSKKIRIPNVKFIMQDSPISTYDILRKSNFVITFGSTIGVEASHLKKPSILVGRAFHEDLNLTININNLRELMLTIDTGVADKELNDLAENTAAYGLFHAVGGSRFKHLQRMGKEESQDPKFIFQKGRIGTWKLISLIRRIEGKYRKNFGPGFEFDCNCQLEV